MSNSSFLSASGASKATTLNARASDNFAAKLAETLKHLLQRAAAEFSPVTQASSLGAEDVVITHLINSLQLDIPVFVLETGALHTETLALLERTEATSRAPIHVYRPAHESVIQFVRTQGQDAMYKSIELRKACCGIRKMEPLARALQGQRAWITGLRQEQSAARAEVPLQDDSEVAAKSLSKFNPLAQWTWGDVWHYIATTPRGLQPTARPVFPQRGLRPLHPRHQPGRRVSRWAAGGGKRSAKECGLHVKN